MRSFRFSIRALRSVISAIVLCVCSVSAADDEFNDPRIKVTVGASVFVPARFDAVVHQLSDGSLFVHGNRSTDGGRTWSNSPAEVRATFHDKWRQSAGCVLRDGTFIGLGSKAAFTRLDQRILKVYRSDDNLQTIVGPTDSLLEIPRGTGGRSETGEYSGAALVEHSLIERKDGTLIAGAYGWWKGDEEYSMLEKYVPEMNLYKTRVWVVGSNDRGKTWKTLGTPGYWPELGPEGMGEPGMTELANGDLLMLLRNGEWGEPIFQTRSTDGGRTWSKPKTLPATGVWPTPCLLSNGMLVVAVGRGRPPHYHLWVSPDGRGETWTSRTLIAEGGKGYASVVETAPGQLVYSGYNKKKRALQLWHVRIEKVVE
ncbi:MAG: hypothetical protein CMJ75_03545 [Planctomycetaceae bacterium]|nr:hypothetical protein [Planctomycetaceae bacterium]